MATFVLVDDPEQLPELPATKWLAVTKAEAELLVDSFKVTNPATRSVALKCMGLCLEFEAEHVVSAVRTATSLDIPIPKP